MKKTQLNKRVERAFNKKVYLLGADADGCLYWLESPSWDCGWYWGFGYVETYTNNMHPSKSRDIESHQHIKGSFIGNIDGQYIHNIYDAPLLASTTFTESEGWELSELFFQFYTLRESAELFHRGKCNIAYTELKHDESKCKETADYINNVMIPAITNRIIKILSK